MSDVCWQLVPLTPSPSPPEYQGRGEQVDSPNREVILFVFHWKSARYPANAGSLTGPASVVSSECQSETRLRTRWASTAIFSGEPGLAWVGNVGGGGVKQPLASPRRANRLVEG